MADIVTRRPPPNVAVPERVEEPTGHKEHWEATRMVNWIGQETPLKRVSSTVLTVSCFVFRADTLPCAGSFAVVNDHH